jgi:hypothetical protein
MRKAIECLGLSLPLMLVLQATSTKAIYAYSPFPEATYLIALLAYALVLWLATTRAWPLRVLDNPVVMIVFVAALWFAIYRLYPYVKSLPGPPTSDTAMMAPLQALRLHRGMYDLDGLINVPASPGPGWVLLNAPFTAWGQSIVYTLLTPVYVALGWIALRLSGRTDRFANLWMLLLFSGLICWQLAVGGYDIPALGVAVLGLYLLAERFSFRRFNWASLLVAVGLGVFATSRLVFPFLAPLFGLLIWKHDRLHAVAFTLVALAVTAGLHAAFYFQSAVYQPFHLMERAETQMGPAMMAAGALATAGLGLAALFLMKPERLSQLGWFVVIFATPFLFISAGELIALKFNVAAWEGANYLVPVAASLIYFILLRLNVDAPPGPARVATAADA